MKSERLSDEAAKQAAEYLATKDPALAPLIKQYGLCPLRPHTDYYRELVESIIGQQLSVKAAASIYRRFVELFGGIFPSPDKILHTTVEELRTAGLSNAKATYVRDLAQHVINGTLEFDTFDQLSNEEIIAELVAVKGIGEWTAHMFMIFSLGRTDILATGDLGIRTAFMRLYGLNDLPTPEVIREKSVKSNWHPYESIVCWYLWQSLDNKPAATGTLS